MGKKESNSEMSLPVIGMLLLGILGALIVAGQCEIINHWPQPVSIAPYFGGEVGFWWGLIIGSAVGLLIGFITDEKHYDDKTYS